MKKKRKISQKNYIRDVESGGDSGRRRKNRDKRTGSVDVDSKYLESSKKADREAQGARVLSKNCSERVFVLSLIIRDFRNKYH